MKSLALAVTASLACAPQVAARTTAGQPVLVELFTSQGCSSCPPADRFVRELPRRGLGPDKVIALTFHVDYWDQLGWADPFAAPAFTDRQTWYANSGRLRAADGPREISGIYTPQMIVAGQVHFPGGQTDVATRQIAEAAAHPAIAALSLDATVGPEVATVRVRVVRTGALAPAEDWRVTAALVQKTAETRVGRGENGGETLQEASVVRALSPRLPLPGGGAAEIVLSLRKPPDLAWRNTALVAFVQSEKSRAVAAVAQIDAPGR
ncbi:MAG TPA: DUF1223 domain-containing protein [Polyangia bacterium]|jgi:hypothetical protein|nr:DUF1223 domain-containing protein [Polyangia bacterium]